jgi:hypothetical protein
VTDLVRPWRVPGHVGLRRIGLRPELVREYPDRFSLIWLRGERCRVTNRPPASS